MDFGRRWTWGPIIVRAAMLAAVLVAAWAATASAATVLRVDAATGNDAGGTNNCQSTPCKTIQNAILQGRSVPDVVAIQVAPGTYNEDLALGAMDSGLTITGAGSGTNPATSTVLTGSNPNPTIITTTAGTASSLSLNHLRILNPAADTAPPLVSGSTELGLADVAIDAQGNATAGIIASGDTTITGGSVIVEGSGGGPAIVDSAALTASNTPISTNAPGSPVVLGGGGPVNLSNSPVTVANTANNQPAIVGGAAGTTLDTSPIDVKGTGAALLSPGPGPSALSNMAVTLENASDPNPALIVSGHGSSLTKVTISGAWSGPAVNDAGVLHIVDSTITSGPAPTTALLVLSDGGALAGNDVSIVRSTIHQRSTTKHGVDATNNNIAVDSSELLGGDTAVQLAVTGGTSRALTVASSTVDAGTLGSRDSGTAQSVTATADNTANSTALVNVQGSILVEAPAATRAGANGTSTVNCVQTEVPGTTQTATPTLGTINCGTGSNGNTFTSSLSSIFANPGTNYALNPTWNGLDSVPESAISLPLGFSDSATDLAGNPRVVNGIGTCRPGVRDRGALELTGHAGVIPTPAIATPSSVLPGAAATFTGSAPNVPSAVPLSFSWHSSDGATGTGARFTHTFTRPGSYTLSLSVTGAAGCTASKSVSVSVHGLDVITGFKVSAKVFRAAGSGPSVVVPRRQRDGTNISYQGTEAATTSFTVQLAKRGRVRGKTCRQVTGTHPTGKRCTVFLSVGAFSHTDTPGANTFHFTGRLLGRKLPPGNYRLRAIPSNAVGKGTAVFANFTIKK